MKTSFIEINDRNLFKEIKAKLDPKSYVECSFANLKLTHLQHKC